jgi:hypothetical protein
MTQFKTIAVNKHKHPYDTYINSRHGEDNLGKILMGIIDNGCHNK